MGGLLTRAANQASFVPTDSILMKAVFATVCCCTKVRVLPAK